MDTFYSNTELNNLGLCKLGKNVKISRNAIIYHPELLEIGDNVRIDDFTTISGKVVLGNYIHISQFCGLYGGTQGIFIEDFTGFSSRVAVYAVSDDYSGQYMTNPTVPDRYTCDIEKSVYIKKHSIIGSGSVVLPGVTIEEGCSLVALTMCRKSTQPWGIYFGVPAKRIANRKKDLLKLEEKLSEELIKQGGGLDRLIFQTIPFIKGVAA